MAFLIPLSLLHQILSADSLSKSLLEVKIEILKLGHSVELISPTKVAPWLLFNDEHFSCFPIPCQTGLSSVANSNIVLPEWAVHK